MEFFIFRLICIQSIEKEYLPISENSNLEKGKRCIVVATSLVEAGVDSDFETVYRELAGVDSVVQAAGDGATGKGNAVWRKAKPMFLR